MLLAVAALEPRAREDRRQGAPPRDEARRLGVDADTSGDLDATERAARKARKARALADFDANGDGKLDDGEIAALEAAIRARFEQVAPTE